MATLPPIENMPAVRPLCVCCHRKLAYFTNMERAHSYPFQVVKRTFSFWKAYPHHTRPIFCTLKCALSFAVQVYDAGYRLTPSTEKAKS